MMAGRSNRFHSSMPHALRILSPWLCSFVVAAVAAGPAVAAGKAAPKAAADRLLTPAQARDCLAQKDTLKAQTDGALKAKADITAERAEIEQRAAELKEEMTTLDRTNADTVAAFNAKVDARDKSIDELDVKVAAYNKQVADLQAAQDTKDKNCADRRYDENQLKDTPKKK